MDSLEQAANYWRAKLLASEPIYRVRVRKLLDLRGAERRGTAIMAGIRRTLELYGLATEPDFQSVWPETLVAIRLQSDNREEAVVPSAQAHTADETGDRIATKEQVPPEVPIDPLIEADLEKDTKESTNSETERESLESSTPDAGLVEVRLSGKQDPLIRVISIPSAQAGLVTVRMDDTIQKATTLMMFSGYSQLPIAQNDREARGLISWESIAKRSLTEPPPTLVRDCRVDAFVIDADASLHEAVPYINSYGCVLVRSQDRKITGIITGSDLSSEFGRSSYAFMCIRTIEITIRGKLHPCVSQNDLDGLEPHSRARVEGDPSSMTFGENVRLLQSAAVWKRMGVSADREEVIKRLEEIRTIRNEVMHFGEAINDENRLKLEQMESFLKQVFA